MSFARHVPRPRHAATVLLALAALALTGCELGDSGGLTGLSGNSSAEDFARGTGSPALATKNTIRIPGEDPTGNAAGAALTVYPSTSAATRPKLVSVVGKNDWRAAIAMSVLAARPLGAPLLLSEDGDVPDITKSAIEALEPVGITVPGRTVKPKALVAGNVEVPEKMPRINLVNSTYEKLSLSIDALWITLNGGKPSEEVIVTTADPALSRFALPAGPLAANTGSPVFFVDRDTVPLATLRAIQTHGKPRIYVVGPPKAISDQLVKRLKRFGTVTRIGGNTPTENAKQVALFSDPQTEWGWGIVSPGHGMVVMNSHREMDVAAGTTLSSGAAFGPLLLNSNANVLDKPLENYLLDIEPGYLDDPADGVYNRAWLLGDEPAISAALQAQIDKLCAIVQITGETGAALTEGDGFSDPVETPPARQTVRDRSMSEFERPELADAPGGVTIDDVRTISGAATPHFSLQIRNRLRRLIEPLPDGDPARSYAEAEIARLERLATELEHGPKGDSDLPTLRETRDEG